MTPVPTMKQRRHAITRENMNSQYHRTQATTWHRTSQMPQQKRSDGGTRRRGEGRGRGKGADPTKYHRTQATAWHRTSHLPQQSQPDGDTRATRQHTGAREISTAYFQDQHCLRLRLQDLKQRQQNGNHSQQPQHSQRQDATSQTGKTLS